jgi:hypothetical protein
MLSKQGLKLVFVALLLVCAMAPRAAAQGAGTATVFGTVKDAQGGVIPGATVTLISDTQSTKSAPVTTNETGDFVFPNVSPDTYTVQVEMPSFKTLKQSGVVVSAAARVAVGTLTIEVGGASETIDVKGEAPIIQAASGERSFVLEPQTYDNIPFVNGQRNYATLATFAPGVDGTTRQGSNGQNTYTMDGVLTMDTGSNGQLLQMNPESIAEVKILTSNYQAEYGRSTGLNIATVSKSGTNQYHGSLYDIFRNNAWNWEDGRTWQDVQNNKILVSQGQPASAPPTVSKQQDRGFSIGGPIGKPGHANKIFFFVSDEFRPRSAGGVLTQMRVPTDAERQGDFSQTRDNNGALLNAIYDASTGLPKSQCVQGGATAACFQDGGVLGKIPANRLYQIGLNILNLYPVHANIQQGPGQSYNYQFTTPIVNSLTSQPAFRLDYQISERMRVSGKGQFQIGNSDVVPGSIPGFNDTRNPVPYIYTWATTFNYQLNPSTFFEGTYGFSQNQLGAPGVTQYYNKNNIGLGAIPTLYPNSGAFDPSYYEVGILNKYGAPFFVNGVSQLPPTFAWGSNLTGPTSLPNLGYPSFLNINRTQDVVLSLTKVAGRHTMKAGFYSQHSYKAENINTGQAPSTQGDLNFAQDSNNPIDTGVGFANAALGIFDTFAQQNILVEGIFVHNTFEGYLQDNWKVGPKLTLDYGVRLTHMQPQYDSLLHASNFFIDKWSQSAAPYLYVAGCSNGAVTCSGNTRNAMNPLTGQVITIPGGNTQAIIGTLVPNSGTVINGIVQAGNGIAKEATEWPALGVAPRFGMAYDVTGKQKIVIRGGAGLFIDRPSLNSFESTAGDPPASFNSTVRYGTLQTLNSGVTTQSAPIMSIIQYDGALPQSVQWNGGVQVAMPWQSVIDVSLVGQHAYNVYSGLSSGAGTGIDLNAPDIGAAFLAKNQDPTLGTSAVPGAAALSGDLLRPLRGLGPIFLNEQNRWNDSELVQTSYTKRFTRGFSAQLNYTYGIRYVGTTGSNVDGSNTIQHRLVHNADGTYSTSPDQGAYEDLMGSNLGLKRHLIKANFVWSLPTMKSPDSGTMKVVAAVANDWQLSGVFSGGSGARYTPTFSYQNNGASVNLTGTPSYPARIVILGDTGTGCSSNQYAQFTTAAFTGPQTNSKGLESGQNYLGGCADHTLDLAIQRTFRIVGAHRFLVRLDVFNALNAVVWNARQTQLQLRSPTDLTVRNPQYVVNGSDTTLAPGANPTVLNSSRLLTTSAGFGAVTGAQAMRSLQLNIRYSF